VACILAESPALRIRKSGHGWCTLLSEMALRMSWRFID
jgi:hypothetical protein